jgi:hypothetical protein
MVFLRPERIGFREGTAAVFTDIASSSPYDDRRMSGDREMIESVRTIFFQFHRASAIRT